MHAPLATRKAFFARTEVIRTFSGLEELAFQPSQLAEAESVRDQLLEECSILAERQGSDALPLDSERLDAMARAVAAEATHRSSVVLQRGNAILAGLLDRLASRLEAVDCDRCAAAGPSFPCGVEVDQRLVDRRGECMLDLQEMFAFATSLGNSLYAAASSDGEAMRHVELRLNTRVLSAKSASQGLVRLGARTDFKLISDRHLSVVTLSVDGSRYGANERNALAYYLVHEIVAHAFYDVRRAYERSHREPYDLWCEGWMDCIAADLLVNSLDGGGLAGCSPPLALRSNLQSLDVVRRCHLERYEARVGVQSHDLNGMRLARKRYQAMRYRLKRLEPTGSFDAMRIVHLGCAIINLNGAATDTVASFNAAAAAFTFGAEENCGLTDEELRFHLAMASFISHRDEKRLVEELT